MRLIGRSTILAEGREAIASGDYRWAVQILDTFNPHFNISTP